MTKPGADLQLLPLARSKSSSPFKQIQDNTLGHALCDFHLFFLLLEWVTCRKNQFYWRGAVYTKWEGMNWHLQLLKENNSSCVFSRKSIFIEDFDTAYFQPLNTDLKCWALRQWIIPTDLSGNLEWSAMSAPKGPIPHFIPEPPEMNHTHLTHSVPLEYWCCTQSNIQTWHRCL